MTRPTKIRIALALVVLGTLAWAVWPGEEAGAVTIRLAGVSGSNANRLSFTITNTSKTDLLYYLEGQEYRSQDWFNANWMPPGPGQRLAHKSATNFVFYVPRAWTRVPEGHLPHQWRLHVSYTPDSTAIRFRKALARFASRHNWETVNRFAYPVARWNAAYGPEMLGNQPAPPAKK